MKILAFCTTCETEWLKKGLSSDEILHKIGNTWMALTSKKIHTWTCPEGHVNKYWLSPHFYDLLYAKALSDLAGKDTRGAVANSYSAWENFVGHTVQLLLQECGVTTKFPEILAERLLGAYTALFAAKTEIFPNKINVAITKIRNDVIHSDLIPSEEQALKVVREVQSLILASRKALHPLHENYSFGLQAAHRAQEDIRASGMNGVTTVWIRSQIDDIVDDKILAIRREMTQE
jgi:hypothetical protein